jgi:hypothetical protein
VSCSELPRGIRLESASLHHVCSSFIYQLPTFKALYATESVTHFIDFVYILFQRNGMIGVTAAGGGGSGPPGGGVRQRTMRAVEYYNSTVLRARVGAGLTGPRTGTNTSSYNPVQDALHRSNSSLELTHDPHHGP